MHEYCLHGDIKPGNIMISSTGVFYVIDFGQSILINSIPESAQEQMYTLREDEVKISKDSVRRFMQVLFDT
jgi:serine/threonine protein kinase